MSWDGGKENRVESKSACPKESGNDLVSLRNVLETFSLEVEALMKTDELTNEVMMTYN